MAEKTYKYIIIGGGVAGVSEACSPGSSTKNVSRLRFKICLEDDRFLEIDVC